MSTVIPMPAHKATLPALALLAAFVAPAAAQGQPSPADARSLETQVAAWLNTITGGLVPLPARPVQFTPEGDHYLVRVPLGALGSVTPANAAFTAKARMLDATRWTLDDEHFPDKLTVTTTEAVPDAPGAEHHGPDGTHPVTVTYQVTLGKQDVHGVFDPTGSQPAANGGVITAVDIVKSGGMAPSISHADQVTTQTSRVPVDDGHTDIMSDTAATGYSLQSELATGTGFNLKAQTVHVVTTVSGLAQEKLAPLLQALAAFNRVAKQAGGDPADGLTPAERAQLRRILVAADAALTGGKLDEALEGLTFDVGGVTGSLAKAGLSFGGDAPQSTLSAAMGFTLDGLRLDSLPPALAAYVPSHFAIRPTVSNIDLAALTKMGMEATAPAQDGQDPPVPDVGSLFAHGGVNLGFDELALDAAGARFSGTGKFNVSGPAQVTGQADFSATGLDDLISRLQAEPMLEQAVPVAIFLKGIARSAGDQLTWQVTVEGARVLVNGVDLSAMTGGQGGRAP